MQQPIDQIIWRKASELTANMYNPNFVLDDEKKLLTYSLSHTGWTQPLFISKDGIIIDGFHRHLLAKNDPAVRSMTKGVVLKDGTVLEEGMVPCVVFDVSDAERKMLTVRINRAKGVHSAVKMHELVDSLINEHKLSVKEVCQGIGATPDEVDLLLKENVFKKLEIEKHSYTEAWNLLEPDKKIQKEGLQPSTEAAK